MRLSLLLLSLESKFQQHVKIRFFYKQQLYKQRQVEIGKKIKQILTNALRLNFC